MPLPYPRPQRPWPALLVVLSVLAGCRSERQAFAPLPAPLPVARVAPVSEPGSPVVAPGRAGLPPAAAQVHPRRPLAGIKPAARPAAPKLRAAQALLARPALRPHAVRVPIPAQAAPADQGLGRIFFFVLGLVLLVLVGLTWGVAALLGIGFWKALGFLGLGLLGLVVLKGTLELLGKG